MPWMQWREYNRAPSELPEGTSGHIILTGRGAVADAVIRRARDAGVPYVILEPDRSTALTLHDDGYHVMVGDLDRSEEHTSELQSLMRISYAVFCLKKKTKRHTSEHNKN